MKRERGYYWIKHKTGTWTIARWIGDEWQTFDWEGFYKDSDFEEIDERRIERFSAIENNQAYYASNKFAEDWWKNKLKDDE